MGQTQLRALRLIQLEELKAVAFLAALVLMLCVTGGAVCAAEEEEQEMTNLAFFQSLNFDDGLSMVIAYCLAEAWAEFRSFSPELPGCSYTRINKFDYST